MRRRKSELTEQQIVEAVKAGRQEGQHQMVCRYAQRVFAMIVRQVTDVMDAQEQTQDTFMRAFSHIDSYDSQRASLSTWLCRIAYRLTLDFLKRRHPLVVSIDDSKECLNDISSEELEAGLSTADEERILQLQQLVDELSADEQMLLTLYYFEDRPLKEIAYITGIEAGPLAKRLYRIRRKLYNRLTRI
ncbi:MAG: sigma-70 family RNA polymerase sigma factor [Prevotella sp.]|nr:sigma-70 family RNA polymerase sigma factor [Prevotella sp.]